MIVARPEVPLQIITPADVRASIGRARRSLEKAAEEIVWQIEMEAWRTLGYPSWSAMREAEYGGAAFMVPAKNRPELVARIRAAGLTQREAAETAGVTTKTIKRDEHPEWKGTNVPSDGSGDLGGHDDHPKQAGTRHHHQSDTGFHNLGEASHEHSTSQGHRGDRGFLRSAAGRRRDGPSHGRRTGSRVPGRERAAGTCAGVLVMSPVATLSRVSEVMQILIDETTADVERYERTPFNGPNVAAQLGEIRAAQVALAEAIQCVIATVEPAVPS